MRGNAEKYARKVSAEIHSARRRIDFSVRQSVEHAYLENKGI